VHDGKAQEDAMADAPATQKDIAALQKQIDELRKWFQDEKTSMHKLFEDEQAVTRKAFDSINKAFDSINKAFHEVNAHFERLRKAAEIAINKATGRIP
jgi:hypothetical protein